MKKLFSNNRWAAKANKFFHMKPKLKVCLRSSKVKKKIVQEIHWFYSFFLLTHKNSLSQTYQMTFLKSRGRLISMS